MFQNVLRVSNTPASEYSHAVFKEEFTTCIFADEGIVGAQDVRSACTQYVSDYHLSVEARSHKYEVSSENDNDYNITSKGINIYVNFMENQCSCTVKQSNALPSHFCCETIIKYANL